MTLKKRQERSPRAQDAPARSPVSFRQRWLSRRALALHLLVLVIAPACALAGWWQATRALAGNGLSWVYSIEWPIFALLAIGGWWQLVHEDPEAYRARKARPAEPDHPVQLRPSERGALDATAPPEPVALPARHVDPATARFASRLAALVGLEFLLGLVGLVTIPFGRPSGWVPSRGTGVYLAHGALGALVLLAAIALVARASGPTGSPTARAVAWTGLVGLAIAGAGGLLTAEQSVERFFGMALMFVGPAVAGFSYLVPAFLRSSRRTTAVEPAP